LGFPTKSPHEFAIVFAALGVIFDLSRSLSGELKVRNKPERIDEIHSIILDLVRRRAVRPDEARSLRGRLGFARSQTFARVGVSVLHALGQVADGRPTDAKDITELLRRLEAFGRILGQMRPRTMKAELGRPCVLFTDGACSEGSGGLPFVTVGAVLFVPGDGPRYFGAEVGASVVAKWAAGNDDQVVGQAELLPILLAKLLWFELLRDQPLLCFVDNDSARYAAIAGWSPVRTSAAILDALASWDAVLGAVQWFARVPSPSNIADGPSRLDFTAVAALKGAVRCELSRCANFGSWEALAARLG